MFLAQGGLSDFVQESMSRLSAKRLSKKGAKGALPYFFNATGHTHHFLDEVYPVPEFPIQYLINAIGFRKHTAMDMLGQEGVGKSTLVMTLLGWFASQNIASLYIETEGKLPMKDRILRSLHPNRETAELFYRHALTITEAFTLEDVYRTIMDYINIMRGTGSKDEPNPYPRSHPIVVVLDTFSKLQSLMEAEEHLVYKMGDEIKGAENMLKAGDFGHARTAQKWMRIFPNWMRVQNVFFIFVRHQNDAGVMAAQSIATSNARNTTSNGGRAIPQSAALQVTVTKGPEIKRSISGVATAVGVVNKITVTKNNHGPGGRKIDYLVNWAYLEDTEETQTRAITFAQPFCEFLAVRKMLGVSAKNKFTFSCTRLGLMDVDPETLYKAIHESPELMMELGVSEGDNSIAVVSDPNFDSYKSIFFVGISQQPGMLRDWVSRMVSAEGLGCEIRSYGGYLQKPIIHYAL